jgi:hypothetical protein
MSGHDVRLGSPPRHTPHPVIWPANDYVPLPSQVQQLARSMLQQITGPTGTHLLG